MPLVAMNDDVLAWLSALSGPLRGPRQPVEGVIGADHTEGVAVLVEAVEAHTQVAAEVVGRRRID